MRQLISITRPFGLLARNKTPLSRFAPSVCSSCRLKADFPAHPPSHSFSTTRPARSEELATVPDEYVPAVNWDGLEWVGTKEWVQDTKDVGKTIEFTKRYLPVRIPREPRVIRWALHRALAEMFTLRRAGRPMNTSLGLTKLQDLEPIPGSYKIIGTPSKGYEIKHEDEAVEAQFLETLVSKAVSNDEPITEKQFFASIRKLITGDAVPEPHQFNWGRIVLNDPEFKLTFAKRFMQLTGMYIPDVAIKDKVTTKSLYWSLIKAQKNKKFALHALRDKGKLPNVNVSANRVSLSDRERSIGRIKILNRELASRGLPEVPGSKNGEKWKQV